MARFRLPEKQLPLFKDFCNVTARNLATGSELPLIGRKLYDSFSRALSHQHYKALLNDSKSYGKGHFDWSDFYFRLMANLHESLGESQQVTYEALIAAQLELRDKYDVMQEFIYLDSMGDSTYSNIMNSEVAEIDFMTVVNRQEHPVIDLSPLNNLKDTKDNISVMRTIVHHFVNMSKEIQDKVIFLGEKWQIEKLLESDPTAAHALLQNPSIKAHNIRIEFLPTDLSDILMNEPEISEIISANTNAKFKMKSDSNYSKFSDFYAWHIKDKSLKNVINLDANNKLLLLANIYGVPEFADYRDVVIIRKTNTFTGLGNEMCLLVEGKADQECIDVLLDNKLVISTDKEIQQKWQESEIINNPDKIKTRLEMSNIYGPKILGGLGWNKAGRILLKVKGIAFSNCAMKGNCTLDALIQLAKGKVLAINDQITVEGFLLEIYGMKGVEGFYDSPRAEVIAREEFEWYSMKAMTDVELAAYPLVEILYKS
jgi:hypothetical protein